MAMGVKLRSLAGKRKWFRFRGELWLVEFGNYEWEHYGECRKRRHVIHINLRVHDTAQEIKDTIIHEVTHANYKDLTEKAVMGGTKSITSAMDWVEGLLRRRH